MDLEATIVHLFVSPQSEKLYYFTYGSRSTELFADVKLFVLILILNVCGVTHSVSLLVEYPRHGNWFLQLHCLPLGKHFRNLQKSYPGPGSITKDTLPSSQYK